MTSLPVVNGASLQEKIAWVEGRAKLPTPGKVSVSPLTRPVTAPQVNWVSMRRSVVRYLVHTWST